MADYKLTEGMPAPRFEAQAADGRTIKLDDLAGKKVVLYFYPKDDTPGCTKEACGFRDVRGELEAAGAVVLGVSKDSVASHVKFRDKYGLDFPLLADPDRTIIDAYDVWREKSMYGKTTFGIERATFLIDGAGTVRKVWRKVKVDQHVEAVVAAVRALPPG